MAKIFFDNSQRLRSGWRAIVFLFVFGLFAYLFGTAGEAMLRSSEAGLGLGTAFGLAVRGFLLLISAILAGWFCGHFLESVPFTALGVSFAGGWLKNFALGTLAGLLTISLAVVIAAVSGGLGFEFSASRTPDLLASLVRSLIVFGLAAAFEEALFRGYLLQTFTRSGLSWLAIALTSLFFGAVHLGNPDSGSISTINTMIAGVWFAAGYLKTRDLWFVWGMHLTWNWIQGSIFGIEVSGLNDIVTQPLFHEIDRGPAWITGSNYGIEASLTCTLALLVSTAAILYLPKRARQNDPPAE